MRDEDKTKEQLIPEPGRLAAAGGERRAISRRFRGRADRPDVGRPGGRLLRVNRRFCEMLGYAESEIVALGLERITHPDDWKRDYPVHFAPLARRHFAVYRRRNATFARTAGHCGRN